MTTKSDHVKGDYKTTSDVQLLLSKRGDRVTKVCKTPEGLLHHYHSASMFTEADFASWTPIEASSYVGRNPDFPIHKVVTTNTLEAFALVCDVPIFEGLSIPQSTSYAIAVYYDSIRVKNGGSGGVSGYCDRLKSQLYDRGIDVTFKQSEIDKAQMMFFNYLSSCVAA